MRSLPRFIRHFATRLPSVPQSDGPNLRSMAGDLVRSWSKLLNATSLLKWKKWLRFWPHQIGICNSSYSAICNSSSRKSNFHFSSMMSLFLFLMSCFVATPASPVPVAPTNTTLPFSLIVDQKAYSTNAINDSEQYQISSNITLTNST